MSKNEQMREQIIGAFPERPIQGCLETFDSPEMCLLEDKETQQVNPYPPNDPALNAQKYVSVFNPSQKEISLLKVDGCMMSSTDARRCDALLFDDKTISFAEMKLDASKTSQRKKQLVDAIKQLEITIALFDGKFSEKEMDYIGFEKEALVFHGVQESPRLTAGRQVDKDRFLEKYKTNLEFVHNQKDKYGNYKNEWVKIF
ncbi:MAG: hypothetical protein H6577_05345 [Lewinellaceae bacterium]|nr:hypothetical protein [Saprospiraceae bacterium]MCB9337529.1 hypothetical protein [Lewinellaceae bacterium]